jgi:hypothetical protein
MVADGRSCRQCRCQIPCLHGGRDSLRDVEEPTSTSGWLQSPFGVGSKESCCCEPSRPRPCLSRAPKVATTALLQVRSCKDFLLAAAFSLFPSDSLCYQQRHRRKPPTCVATLPDNGHCNKVPHGEISTLAVLQCSPLRGHEHG